MYRTIKQLITNARGATLFELLAVLLLSFLIVFFTGTVIVNATKAYEKTQIEAQLRDEADLILSKIIKDMFPLKDSEIDGVQGDACTACEQFHGIVLKNGKRLGFEGKNIVLLNDIYTVQNRQLALADNYSITQVVDSTTKKTFYEITFGLKHEPTDTTVTFSNTFGTLQ